MRPFWKGAPCSRSGVVARYLRARSAFEPVVITEFTFPYGWGTRQFNPRAFSTINQPGTYVPSNRPDYEGVI
jgi:hypothetical protein